MTFRRCAAPGPVERIAHARVTRSRALPLHVKVAQLRDRGAWADRTRAITAIETHLSWVFLTTRHAWKMKKPDGSSEVDLRGIAARKRNCRIELRLNRRLAPDVYRGVVPLKRLANGALRVGGPGGAVVDWLVKMRRLPAERMLDRMLISGAANTADIERIVGRLAAFYRTLPAAGTSPREYCARFAVQIACNEAQLGRLLRGRISEVRAVCALQRRLLSQCRPRLERRVHAGRVVEGHGDLRPEHVCLTEPVAIIDCLEFSKQLRIVDTLDEVGYLALECARLGAAPFGDALLVAYRKAMRDPIDPSLLHFYQSYRASIRARLAAAHLCERGWRRGKPWRSRAGEYLDIALHHARACAAALRAGGTGAPRASRDLLSLDLDQDPQVGLRKPFSM